MTLGEFQEELRRLVPEVFRLPRVFAALTLVVEVSEFVSESLEPSGDPGALMAELGDILFSCAEIANEYGFSLDGLEDDPPVSDATRPGEFRDFLARLGAAVGEVAKAVLDIECFDSTDHTLLIRSVRRAACEALWQARSRGLDSQAAMCDSLERIRGRIESGGWKAKYGDVLRNKRRKYN